MDAASRAKADAELTVTINRRDYKATKAVLKLMDEPLLLKRAKPFGITIRDVSGRPLSMRIELLRRLILDELRTAWRADLDSSGSDSDGDSDSGSGSDSDNESGSDSDSDSDSSGGEEADKSEEEEEAEAAEESEAEKEVAPVRRRPRRRVPPQASSALAARIAPDIMDSSSPAEEAAALAMFNAL
jgi:hypothetical protein